MPLAQNKAITFNYTLKDDEGNILDTTKGSCSIFIFKR